MDDNKYLLGCQSLTEMVQSLLIREDDVRGTKFRKYFEIAKDVYRDLNLYAIRFTKRRMIEVDKNTNSVRLPKECLMFTSVEIIDDCGRLQPLILNRNITGDVIDINLDKDCHCECGCQSQMCGSVKNYEVVYETVYAPVPGGGTEAFETYSRKTIYPNGDYYWEYNKPVPKYEDGVIVETPLEEFKEFICKLEVADCGCVKEKKENMTKLNECCGANIFYTECGPSSCCPATDNLTYGYEQFGDRINFDSTFNHDRVMVRYFVEGKGKDIMVPIVAKRALMMGIQADQSIFDSSTGYTAIARERKLRSLITLYRDEKKILFRLLNRISLKAFYTTIIPARKMP